MRQVRLAIRRIGSDNRVCLYQSGVLGLYQLSFGQFSGASPHGDSEMNRANALKIISVTTENILQ